MKLDWTCLEPGHHQSHCGRYSIERLRAEHLNPHPWLITGPDGVYQQSKSLASAKARCRDLEARLTSDWSPYSEAVSPEDAAERRQRLQEFEVAEKKRRDEDVARFKERRAKAAAAIASRLGVKPPTEPLKGGLKTSPAKRQGRPHR